MLTYFKFGEEEEVESYDEKERKLTLVNPVEEILDAWTGCGGDLLGPQVQGLVLLQAY